MRTVIFFMLTSLNGFYERAPWAIDWHNAGDEEFNEFAIAQLDAADTLLFGRKTYEGMATYWPTPEAIAEDRAVATRMNTIQKIVFSRTLSEAAWQNTRVVRDDPAAEVRRLKAEPGRDLIVMGSGDLATSLAEHALIDDIRVMVNPLALPTGKPLFSGLKKDLPLRLRDVRRFRSGNVLLSYAPRV